MGMVSETRKVFQLDVLSLALACVISLLFAKGVVEFLNQNSKKENRQACVLYIPQSDQEEQMIIVKNNHLQFPVKNNAATEYYFLMIVQQFTTSRICLAAGSEVQKQFFQPTNCYLDQFYKNMLPSRWGATVSIAHCKLVI